MIFFIFFLSLSIVWKSINFRIHNEWAKMCSSWVDTQVNENSVQKCDREKKNGVFSHCFTIHRKSGLALNPVILSFSLNFSLFLSCSLYLYLSSYIPPPPFENVLVH